MLRPNDFPEFGKLNFKPTNFGAPHDSTVAPFRPVFGAATFATVAVAQRFLRGWWLRVCALKTDANTNKLRKLRFQSENDLTGTFSYSGTLSLCTSTPERGG